MLHWHLRRDLFNSTALVNKSYLLFTLNIQSFRKRKRNPLSMEKFVSVGKEFGLEGKELMEFVKQKQMEEEQKEKEKFEREERVRERELKKMAMEAEDKKRHLEAQEKVMQFEAEDKKRHLEAQEKVMQFEAEEKQRQFELEMKRLEIRSLNQEANENTESFHAKPPKLQPFSEDKEKMDYFLERFERFAIANKWKEETWAIRISALLTGKALEFYSRLPRQDSNDYNILKSGLLRYFDFTEEGYRRRFSSCRPEGDETPSQFIERIRSYLENWIELAGLEKKFEDLRDLFIKEQLINVCSKDLAVHLKRAKNQDLTELADRAQRYLESNNQKLAEAKFRASTLNDMHHSVLDQRKNRMKHEMKCFSCGGIGHKAVVCPTKSTKDLHLRPFHQSNTEPGSNRSQPKHVSATIMQKDEPKLGSAEQVSQDELESFEKDGRIPMGDKFIPVINTEIPLDNVGNMPVVTGCVEGTEVKTLRDTGCSTVIVREDLVPENQKLNEKVTLILANRSALITPVAIIDIDTPYLSGKFRALCMKTPAYDLIIGNVDGARDAYNPDPNWKNDICAVTTRAQEKKIKEITKLKVAETTEALAVNREKLIELQKADPSFEKLLSRKESRNKRGEIVKFEVKKDVLYRVCNKGDEKEMSHIVIPESLRAHVMKLLHDSIMGGHLGINKTLERINSVFYWPDMAGDVMRYCKSCDICQKTISKGRMSKVPLEKMPLIDMPFKRVAVDIVGPIFPTSEEGHRYLLTLVDYATRYPEATPLKKIDTPTVAEALVDMFSRLGIPEEILSDLGTQFISTCMAEVNKLLSIRHLTTTPYHPMCNGLVEKFNGTLKSMLKKLCAEQPRMWHRYINALLFAYREVPQESTGFSPFELLYGRTVRGPMYILKELWTKEIETPEVKNSYQYVFELREKLEDTLALAKGELEKAQSKAKHYYDRRTKPSTLSEGDKVLVLLPTDNNKLLMQWKGPFVIEQTVGLNDYKIKVKGKLKTYHANLLKKYIDRDDSKSLIEKASVSFVNEDTSDDNLFELNDFKMKESAKDAKIGQNLTVKQQEEIRTFVEDFKHRFTPDPGTTDIIQHEVKLTSEQPIYSKPYRLPFHANQELKNDIKEMLDLGIIRESKSAYASPVVIVKIPDGSNRVCADYRKLNKVTVFDPEPMPTTEELFQKLSNDNFFSKIDLSKGYWQVKVAD